MPFENEAVDMRDGSSRVVLDTTHWPIVFATWFGEPTEPLVAKYFKQHDKTLQRARSTEQPFILVTDTFATKQPSAKARKLIADLTAAQPTDATKFTYASYIVIESALIRGVVTALRWILPRMADSESVDSVGKAIERSLALLDSKGVARPPHIMKYKRPAA
jgi:hypothetical protein